MKHFFEKRNLKGKKLRGAAKHTLIAEATAGFRFLCNDLRGLFYTRRHTLDQKNTDVTFTRASGVSTLKAIPRWSKLLRTQRKSDFSQTLLRWNKQTWTKASTNRQTLSTSTVPSRVETQPRMNKYLWNINSDKRSLQLPTGDSQDILLLISVEMQSLNVYFKFVEGVKVMGKWWKTEL